MKISSDTIIAVCMVLGVMGGFAAWADTRYAHQETVAQMQAQVAQIYEKLIPQAERR